MSDLTATRAPSDAPTYQVNAYQRSFSARVARVEGNAVQLEGSALYPGGGGQPADHGMLRADGRAWRVSGAKLARDDADPAFPAAGVWHLLERDGGDEAVDDHASAPVAGAEVEGELDWERRYRLMRTHTALHILCAVVWRDYGAKVTGANMEPLRGRMDFEFDALSGEFVRELEQKVNAEVAAARPTRVDFLPRAEADRDPELIRNKVSLLPPSITVVRVVGIEGLDLQADGGTHVANTREVGRIELPSYKSKGRINKRVELTLTGD